MRALDDAGLMRQFRVSDDRVALRLGDPYHLLIFGSDWLDVAALRPERDEERLRVGVEEVWSRLSPRPFGRLTVSFQWLDPITMSYDEARKSAGERVVRCPAGIHPSDFALVFDADVEDPLGVTHVEAGVVDSDETPERLARVRRGPAPEVAPSLWPQASLPDVALFCDQEWDLAEPPDSVDSLLAQWERMHGVGEEVTVVLREKLLGAKP